MEKDLNNEDGVAFHLPQEQVHKDNLEKNEMELMEELSIISLDLLKNNLSEEGRTKKRYRKNEIESKLEELDQEKMAA